MTREEQIHKGARNYVNDGKPCYDTASCYELDAFEQGAEWADAHPKSTWMSVEDDLPCNHKELIMSEEETVPVLVCSKGIGVYFDKMKKYDDKWEFIIRDWEYWTRIPNLD